MNFKKCVLILGMHRSGTSAISGALNAIGINFGTELASASYDNPIGYFENNKIQELNDTILEELGLNWDYPSMLPDGWQKLPKIKKHEKEAAKILKAEFGSSPLIGIKDPRICHLLPFWLRVLQKAKFDVSCLFSIRSPYEVALSLKKRNNFNFNKSHITLTSHLLSAELHSRKQNRCAVAYNNLLKDPEKVLRSINNSLSLGIATRKIKKDKFRNIVVKKLKHNSAQTSTEQKSILLPYFLDHYKLWDSVFEADNNDFKLHKEFDAIRDTHLNYTSLFFDGIITSDKYFFKAFIDTGKGFNEKQTIVKKIKGNINSWDNSEIADFENIKQIKIVPINEKSVLKLEYLGIEGVEKDSYTLTHNAYHVDGNNVYYFDTAHPEIIIEFQKKSNISKLLTTIDYQYFGEEVNVAIQNLDYRRIIKSKDLDVENFENIISDRDHYLKLKDKEINDLTSTILEMDKNQEKREEEVQSIVDQLNNAIESEKNDKINLSESLNAALEAERIDKKNITEKLNQNIQSKDHEIKALSENLRVSIDAEKNDKIHQLESLRGQYGALLTEKDDELKALSDQLRVSVESEKNDKIKQLEELRSQLNGVISSKDQIIAEKENELKALTEQLRISLSSEKDDKFTQLDSLRSQYSAVIDAKDQEIKGLIQNLSKSVDSEKNDKSQKLTELRNHFESRLAEKDKSINEMRDSFQVRLTQKENELNEIRLNLMSEISNEKNDKISQLQKLKDSFHSQLNDREKELNLEIKEKEGSLRNLLVEKERLFAESKEERIQLDKEYREVIDEIKSTKDLEISELRSQYRQAIDDLRKAKDEDIKEKQEDISTLKELLAEEQKQKHESITKLQSLIEKERLEKKNEILLLRAHTEREVDELVNNNNRLLLDIADLKSTLLSKINEGEYAEQVIDTMNQELDVMKQIHQLKEKEIEEIRRSLSFKLGWTFTAPARITYNLFTGAKKSTKQAKLLIDLAENGIKKPKQLLKSLNKENIETLKRALKTESPALIVRNFRNHLNNEPPVTEAILSHESDDSKPLIISSTLNPNKKNILFVSPNLPDFDESAGGKRAWYMLKLLQEEYQVYAYTRGQKPDHHRRKLEEDGIIIIDTHNFENVKRSIPQFDTIIFGWYYTMNECSYILKYYPESTIIMDTVDIHWVREKRSLGNWDGIDEKKWAQNKEKELDVYRRADKIWVVSQTDADAIHAEISGADIAIVSIIEDIKKDSYLDPQTNNILFLGGYRHYPNINAAKILANDIFPKIKAAIPNAKLIIAGAHAPDDIKALGKLDGIEFRGFINDEDIEGLYRETFLSIVPLLAGAGVKGKICEAISYSVPVITNAIGNEGINLEHKTEAFITENTDEMAAFAIQLMQRTYDLPKLTRAAQSKLSNLVGPEMNKARMINSIVKQVSICIVTYNKIELLKKCISSILGNTKYSNYKILVHSNGCEDGTQEYLSAAAESDSRIIPILSKENEVFVLPNNKMMRMFDDNDAVLVNNDVEVTEGWLTALVDAAYSSKNIGIVGSKILFPDGKLQEFGGELYSDGSGRNIGKWEDPNQEEYKVIKRASFVSGCSFYIKRSTINAIGVFDEQFHPCYCEDADYCYSAWENGLETIVTPHSIIFHFEGATSGTDTSSGFKKYQKINMEKFHKKHGDQVDVVNEKVKSLNQEAILI